ncbi:MAG: hypothetical protein FWF84_06190, partial [Kiritimatiellaeota bacterium]|nr:hypothetical protein [Kiritimatiellota bacterium]
RHAHRGVPEGGGRLQRPEPLQGGVLREVRRPREDGRHRRGPHPPTADTPPPDIASVPAKVVIAGEAKQPPSTNAKQPSARIWLYAALALLLCAVAIGIALKKK